MHVYVLCSIALTDLIVGRYVEANLAPIVSRPRDPSDKLANDAAGARGPSASKVVAMLRE